MPKENTHISFANDLLSVIKKKKKTVGKIIEDELFSYRMGSYFPDIFYYDKRFKYVSAHIHGEKNNQGTNQLIFFLLRSIEKNDTASLSFIFGLLTHFALDITFHPLINHQTKDIYEHVRFETNLDKEINGKKSLIKKIDLKTVSSNKAISKLERFFDLPSGKIAKLYKKHFLFNSIFRCSAAYFILFIMEKFKIIPKDNLGLFYADLKKNELDLGKYYDFIDPNTQDGKRVKIDELFDKAGDLAVQYIITAYNYKNGLTEETEAAKLIRGESLTTGKIPKQFLLKNTTQTRH
jgi:hypothetical protein